jgi:hypothetical protein
MHLINNHLWSHSPHYSIKTTDKADHHPVCRRIKKFPELHSKKKKKERKILCINLISSPFKYRPFLPLLGSPLEFLFYGYETCCLLLTSTDTKGWLLNPILNPSRSQKWNSARSGEYICWDMTETLVFHQKLVHCEGVTRLTDMLQIPAVSPFSHQWHPLTTL